MRIVPVSKLLPSDVLAKSVFLKDGTILAPSGLALSVDMIDALENAGIQRVYTSDHPLITSIEEKIREIAKASIHLLLATSQEKTLGDLPFAEIFTADHISARLQEGKVILRKDEINSSLRELVALVAKGIESVEHIVLAFPPDALSQAELQHAIDTALVAAILGRKFDFPEKDLRTLIHCSLLHDTGRWLFPDINETSSAEYDRFRKIVHTEHPVYSALILGGCDPGSQFEQSIVLQHHEQTDGSGFPQGLTGLTSAPMVLRKEDHGKLNRFTDILIAANAFCGALNPRRGEMNFPPAIIIEQLSRVRGKAFNPHVIAMLSGLFQLFASGNLVVIRSNSSGRYVGFSGIVKESSEAPEKNPCPIQKLLLTHNAQGKAIPPVDYDLASERRALFDMLPNNH